ncbi:Peroxisome biogenesis protein 16 [Linum grandiflorum]
MIKNGTSLLLQKPPILCYRVVVRLALFRNSGYRMLLQGGETPNVENPSDLSRTSKPGNLVNGRSPGTGQGKALSALSRFRENARTLAEPDWLRRVHHQNSIIDPPAPVVQVPSLSKILSERGASGALLVLGEALFITRPLLYVLLIRKYGVRSWVPWFVSLAVDVIGVGFVTPLSKLQFRERDQQIHLNDLEKHELRRRKLLWAFYLMRDPFFGKYTRQRLDKTEKTLEPVPLVGVLTGCNWVSSCAGKLVELVCGAQTRYTYMSGS